MFYTSEQNLQERAYRMEETFKTLGKLKNKINIMIKNKDKISECECEKFYKEYERIIESIENHEEIDYYFYKLDNLRKKEKHIEKYIEINKEVIRYKRFNKLNWILARVIPAIFILGVIVACYV